MSGSLFDSPMHALLGGGKVADILLWENKKLSGGILVGITVLWVLFELVELSFITFLCYILMFVMIILLIWSKMAGLTKRNPPASGDIQLPESAFKFLSDQINQTLLELYDAATGQKGLKAFFLALTCLYVLSFVGSLFSTMTFSYIVFACAVTIPALYERNKMQVDEIAGQSFQEVKKSLKLLSSQVLDRIPRSKRD